MASLSEFTFPGTVGDLQARPGSGMVNCNSNNKGDTDQTYFKTIVGASCAILQVTCP